MNVGGDMAWIEHGASGETRVLGILETPSDTNINTDFIINKQYLDIDKICTIRVEEDALKAHKRRELNVLAWL